jgi:crotonobetainyl-CoA:carnitine CoA-transferase CaiB-like acyl-CoA transferase
MGILSGVHVVESTHGLAGPMTAQLLADVGAEVIRVDTGDESARRQQGSAVRLRGRRSIRIDVTNPRSLPLLERLAAWADVLLSEPALDGRPPLPLGYEELAAINPRLVFCRITARGDEGPLASGFHQDHLVSARFGVYEQAGWRPGPTFLTAPVASIGAALLAFQAIGNALYARERTRAGQEVATSLLAGCLSMTPGMIKATVERPLADTGLAGRSPLGNAPFYSIYECGDGEWLHFGCLTQEFQRRAMAALGLTEELTALGFGQGRFAPPETRSRIIAAIAARMRERPFAEWADLFEREDIPYARSQWTEDLLDDPQVRDQGLVITVDDPLLGPVEQMAAPFAFSEAPSQPPRPAPLPGEHTDEVCRELGLTASDIRELREAGAIS